MGLWFLDFFFVFGIFVIMTAYRAPRMFRKVGVTRVEGW